METHDVVAELMLDDSFVAWVLSDGRTDQHKWQQWLHANPDKALSFNRARGAILSLQNGTVQLKDERKALLRQRILDSINKRDEALTEMSSQDEEYKIFPVQLGIAASILLVFAIGLWMAWTDNPEKRVGYATAFGEIKTFVLPDSSRVTLNGNSTLTYTETVDGHFKRELWLEGEGFFDVRKVMVQHEESGWQALKFLVHTDNLSINVLGTRFNVKHRSETSQVILEEGSIQLEVKDQDEPLMMQPSELVEVSREGELINQKSVNPSEYVSWKDGFIHLNGASFADIRSILKDNYGLDLHFKNSEHTEQIKLRGSFPAQDIDILIEAIANITQTSMRKKGNEIVYQ